MGRQALSGIREMSLGWPPVERVMGDASLEVEIEDGKIRNVKLRVFEPPRFFEKLAEGRHFDEVVELVARICGTCPVAHQLTAVQAFEDLFRVDPGSWVRDMRRVMHCGEWIQSHAVHLHLIAAPDFLGCAGLLELGKRFPAEVRRGLELQALGRDLVRLFGGRAVHPVGLCVGGLHGAPETDRVAAVLDRLERASTEARALVEWFSGFPLPEYPQAFTGVALSDVSQYAMADGRILSGSGVHIDIRDFESRFKAYQVPHSTAFHVRLDSGPPYMVGPLARLNLNVHQLSGEVRDHARGCGFTLPSHNPFRSALARAVEVHFAVTEAARLLRDYRPPEQTRLSATVRSGTAIGCVESPRGLLWHRYEVDAEGLIQGAKIVPPTAQNLARIEADIAGTLAQLGPDRSVEELRALGERIVRSYDPCIPCATHFLRLRGPHG